MKYQIQFYSPDNYDDPATRTIVARGEAADKEELQKWFESVMVQNPLSEGKQVAVVAEDNPWFIQDEQAPEPTKPTKVDTGPRLLTFEEIQKATVAREEQYRAEQVARDRRLAEYMAAFEG